jgi:hypothetical protein
VVLVNQHGAVVARSELRVHEAEGAEAVVYGVFVEALGAPHSEVEIAENSLEVLPSDSDLDTARSVRIIMVGGAVDTHIRDNHILGLLNTAEAGAEMASAAVLSESEGPVLIQRNSIQLLAQYGWSYGIHINRVQAPLARAVIRNNLIELAAVTHVAIGVLLIGVDEMYLNNNTIVGAGAAPGAGAATSLNLRVQNSGSGALFYVRNNLFQSSDGDRCWDVDAAWTGADADFNNLSCSGQCPGLDCPADNNSTVDVVFADCAAGDYSLVAQTDEVVRSGGVDLSGRFTDDLNGDTRQGPWSRGAYQAQ